MKHETTARRLREAMGDCNITARELSQRACMNESSISQYVTGRNVPSNINSGKMAKVLGVNPVWLMGFDVPKYVTQKEAVFLTEEEKELIESLRKLSGSQQDMVFKMLGVERKEK